MIVKFIRSHIDILALGSILGFFTILFAVLQNPTSLDDGLRHFAMARLMAEQGVAATNGWQEFLHEGYLSTLNVDPWFLSDVLLIPFTSFSVGTGLKLFCLFQLFCVGLAALCVLQSLRLSSFQSGVFLLILFFGDQQFLGRLLLARPFGIITALAILVVWSILERRYLVLGLILGISVLLSQLFVFVAVIACMGCAWLLLQKQYKECAYGFISIAFGCLAGLILHPYTGEYLVYLYDAFIRIPFLNAEVELSAEMQSGLANISAISVIVGLGTAALLIALDVHKKSWKDVWSNAYMYVVGVCLFLLPMFGLWVRTIDLLWPMIVFVIADLWRRQYPRISHYTEQFLRWSIVRMAILLLALGQVVAVPYTFIRDDADKALSAYESLAVIPAESTVLNVDWNRFFAYVALRPDLSYATGIDPVFTYLTNPRATEITRLLKSQTPSSQDRIALLQELWHIYPSQYIVLYKKTYTSTIAALQSPDWEIVSSSGAIVIVDATRSSALRE